jgi:hypothetical protein
VNATEFRPGWADLRAAYPRETADPATAALYARKLADFETAEVLAAIDTLIETSRFLPTIAEIRAEIRRHRADYPSNADGRYDPGSEYDRIPPRNPLSAEAKAELDRLRSDLRQQSVTAKAGETERLRAMEERLHTLGRALGITEDQIAEPDPPEAGP